MFNNKVKSKYYVLAEVSDITKVLNIPEKYQHDDTLWYEDEEGNTIPHKEGDVPDKSFYQHFRHVSLMDEMNGPDGFHMAGSNGVWWGAVEALIKNKNWDADKAAMTMGIACERCMNALAWWANTINKENGERDGYPIFGPEWNKTNTECEFCEHHKKPESKINFILEKKD